MCSAIVVDDYAPFRRFICAALQAGQDVQVVAELSDGLEAVHRAEELQPDLILLDIGLPNLNGIQAARRIRSLCPESKILFVSQDSDPDVIEEALSLGALGYVVKAHASTELLAAVETVCGGGKYISNRNDYGSTQQ